MGHNATVRTLHVCVSRARARLKVTERKGGLLYVGRADEREGTHKGEGVRALWEQCVVQWYG